MAIVSNHKSNFLPSFESSRLQEPSPQCSTDHPYWTTGKPQQHDNTSFIERVKRDVFAGKNETKEQFVTRLKEEILEFAQVDDELKNNKDFILRALKHNCLIFNHINPVLQNDREVVIKAMSNDLFQEGGFSLTLTLDLKEKLKKIEDEKKLLQILSGAQSYHSEVVQYLNSPSIEKDTFEGKNFYSALLILDKAWNIYIQDISEALEHCRQHFVEESS